MASERVAKATEMGHAQAAWQQQMQEQVG